MKKKITAVILSIVMTLLLLAGCGSTAEEKQNAAATAEKTNINVGSLKGPTSMGLVYLMDQSDKGEATQNYTFTMASA
ncbi:MAG: ABC transporter substrate-binding protein, partial [Lachnospiraceae bacterium]|nr:ABC transporter substrate-binding protein [Lachnospiraceae bacterium]